jgi:hypothetical protein
MGFKDHEKANIVAIGSSGVTLHKKENPYQEED